MENNETKINEEMRELTDEELAEIAGGFDIEDRVIRGDYGNGEAREYRLRADGYDYGRVQNEINRRLGYEKKRPEWFE